MICCALLDTADALMSQKRSQRFTVPIQPPNPAASPPFSNSDDSSAATTSASIASDSHLFPSNERNHNALLQAGMSVTNLAYKPFPFNFAQTGHPASPAFLQQDPFAFAGGLQGSSNSARTRTLSVGNSSPSWSDPNTFGALAFASAAGQNALAYPGLDGGSNNVMHELFQASQGFGVATQQQLSQQQQQQQQQINGDPDDVIPTAIVVKNIPFTFPSTSLLQIIEELTLSPPYAFNYHYDSGVFRGLAFANFHTPQETDACVAALNGFEIQGRKLRVEYKKVLQAGEKERIERDKAIKRMRSMQLERERLFQHQAQLQQQFLGNQQLQQQRQTQQQQTDDWEDYGRAIHPSNSLFSNNSNSIHSNTSPALLANVSNSAPPGSSSSSDQQPSSVTSKSSRSATSAPPYELDMNDPSTLEIYSRVLLFKDDGMRDELAFSRSLTSLQRRVVHLVAQKLGLDHRSSGMGEDRHVIVAKGKSNVSFQQQQQSQQQQQRLRGRASAYPLLSPDANGGSSIAHSMMAAAAMRKKSMPDLRHQQSHPYPIPNQQYYSQGMSTSPLLSSASTSSASLLTPKHSNYDLRAASRRQDLSLPPLPAQFQSPFSAAAAMSSFQGQSPHVSASAEPQHRHSLLFSQSSDDDSSPGLARAVGSPVSAGSSLSNGLPAALVRQPRGPDGTNSWARAVVNGAGGTGLDGHAHCRLSNL